MVVPYRKRGLSTKGKVGGRRQDDISVLTAVLEGQIIRITRGGKTKLTNDTLAPITDNYKIVKQEALLDLTTTYKKVTNQPL